MTTTPNGEHYGKSGERISLVPLAEEKKTGKAGHFRNVAAEGDFEVADDAPSFTEKLRRKTGVIAARLVYLKCRIAELAGD